MERAALEELVHHLIIRYLLSVDTVYSVGIKEVSGKATSEVAGNAPCSKREVLVPIRSTASAAIQEAAECPVVEDCVRQARIPVGYHDILEFRSLLVQRAQELYCGMAETLDIEVGFIDAAGHRSSTGSWKHLLERSIERALAGVERMQLAQLDGESDRHLRPETCWHLCRIESR